MGLFITPIARRLGADCVVPDNAAVAGRRGGGIRCGAGAPRGRHPILRRRLPSSFLPPREGRATGGWPMPRPRRWNSSRSSSVTRSKPVPRSRIADNGRLGGALGRQTNPIRFSSRPGLPYGPLGETPQRPDVISIRSVALPRPVPVPVDKPSPFYYNFIILFYLFPIIYIVRQPWKPDYGTPIMTRV